MASLLKTVTNYDTLALQWYLGRKSAARISRTSRWVSRLGNGELYLVIGLLCYFFEPVTGKAFFYTGLVAYAIELSIYFVLKNTTRRRRPYNLLSHIQPWLQPSDKFSFPSGHTAAAFVFATLLHTFYPSFSSFAYACAFLIGSSRVFLCVHFPTDILAGLALGILSTLSALSLMGY